MSAESARRVWFLQAARDDVGAAFEWYERQRAGLGGVLIESVDAALRGLAEFPESSPVFYRDTRRCLLEQFPFEIFYRVDGDLIIVVALIHGARDPHTILSRVRD